MKKKLISILITAAMLALCAYASPGNGQTQKTSDNTMEAGNGNQ